MRFDLRLPAPPERLRRGPFRDGAFPSPLHDERVAAIIGRWLGIAFAICFVTGLISHGLQHPPAWLAPPSRPVWGYRLTQGLHVATGLAAIPLLLAKLWTVYPRLFAWPPASSLLHALERASLAVLVAGSVFELVTGTLNIIEWYPWPFPFIQSHFWVGWITVGALLVHIAAKAPQISAALSRPPEPGAEPRDGLSRRGFLAATAAAAGVVTVTTVGQTATPLKGLDLLGPRHPDHAPQGVPILRTAAAAGVAAVAVGAGWRLEVAGPRPYALTMDELAAMPQHAVRLPITCVEGWSVTARWTGVRLRELLDRAGAPPDARIRVVSLERNGPYGQTEMAHTYARDPLTLLALTLNGAPLTLDHGYPARIIAPNRPGVLQTKWVTRLEVLP